MEKKYIDRDLAAAMLENELPASEDRADAVAMILAFPAADVEKVRHGRIIMTGRRYPYCSECDVDLEHTNYRWCPWCGARMDGNTAEDDGADEEAFELEFEVEPDDDHPDGEMLDMQAEEMWDAEMERGWGE